MAYDDNRSAPLTQGLAGVPSDTSVRRLKSSLHDEFGGYKDRVHFDLMAAEVLHEEGDLDAAAHVLREHIEVLSAFASHLDTLVSQAAVEREAEAIVDAAWLAGFADGLDDDEPPDAAEDLGPGRSTARQRVRNLIAAAAAALVVVVALVTPNGRGELDSVLVAAERATDEAVAVAQALSGLSEPVDMVGLERRTIELHDRIRALPQEQLRDATVRDQLEHILSTQAQTLAVLVPRLPHVRWLLEQLEALAADLSLRLEYQQPKAPAEPAAAQPLVEEPSADDAASAPRPAQPDAAGAGQAPAEQPQQPAAGQAPDSGGEAPGGPPAEPQGGDSAPPPSGGPDDSDEDLLRELLEELSDPDGEPENDFPPALGEPG